MTCNMCSRSLIESHHEERTFNVDIQPWKANLQTNCNWWICWLPGPSLIVKSVTKPPVWNWMEVFGMSSFWRKTKMFKQQLSRLNKKGFFFASICECKQKKHIHLWNGWHSPCFKTAWSSEAEKIHSQKLTVVCTWTGAVLAIQPKNN